MPSTTTRTWWLYLLECQDGSFYAGITTDVDARYAAHASGRGARYTRSHPPLRLIGVRAYENRAAASRAEWEIKQLPKHRKPGFLAIEQV
jgi:putative endonuclease